MPYIHQKINKPHQEADVKSEMKKDGSSEQEDMEYAATNMPKYINGQKIDYDHSRVW